MEDGGITWMYLKFVDFCYFLRIKESSLRIGLFQISHLTDRFSSL